MLIGSKIIPLKYVDSTSNYTANLVKRAAIEEGTVILSHFQSNGRGQGVNLWQSEAGLNLTFSFYIRPLFVPLNQQFILSKLISIAIVSFLSKRFNINANIKWPNDILVNGKKISGILIENTVKGSKITDCVVGIGLNVNQVNWENGIKASSLKLIRKEDFNPEKVLQDLLQFINKEYQKLIFDGFEEIEMDYLSYLFGYKETVDFEDGNGKFKGQIAYVDISGKIYIQPEDDILREYWPKDIKFIF